MKLRTPLTAWCTTFAAALGLVPGCSGRFSEVDPGTGGTGPVTGVTGGSGGAPSTIGGAPGVTGGAPGMTGGAPGMTGGATSASGGTGGSIGIGGFFGTGGVVSSGGSGGAIHFGGTVSWAGCPDSSPIVQANGVASGYGTCSNGVVHKTGPARCQVQLPRAQECPNFGPSDQCSKDSDCPGPYGTCNAGQAGCYCQTGCEVDEDCQAGSVCLCGESVGQCVPSDCRSDADCGENFLCTQYLANPFCGGPAFACQTERDLCVSDDDCSGRGQPGTVCTLEEGAPGRTCSPGNCVIGRPFLVQGEERTAAITAGAGWASQVTASACPDAVREEAAAHWAKIGQMEHASVAAFARFSLQLLALGAPAHLLEASQRAAQDEIRHARDAFTLASHYAECVIGPGRLAIDGALAETTPLEVLTTTLLEGCIGETVAAIEALEAAQSTSDSALSALLRAVSEDEARHAQLAYQSVQWILRAHPELAPAAASLMERALFEEHQALAQAPAKVEEENQELLRLGILPLAYSREIRRRVLSEVVQPCLRALLGAPGACRASRDFPEPSAHA